MWRKKTGCRRRIVIKEDLGAEEQKTSPAGNTIFSIFQNHANFWGNSNTSQATGCAYRRAPVPGPMHPPLAQSQSRESQSSIIQSKMTDEQLFVGARTMAGNSPPEVSTKQTLRESGDQPLVRSTRGRSTGQLSRSYLRRLVNQVNRLQQQIVENQISTWPTRYLVLGGFTPGTPVSTPFSKRFEKNTQKKRQKEIKRKDSKRDRKSVV